MRITTHPGEVLREEFMAPLKLSANALALELHVPATRIGEIIRARKPRAVTPDTALRLGRYFGTTPDFWLNLQTAYDLSLAQSRIGGKIKKQVSPRAVFGAAYLTARQPISRRQKPPGQSMQSTAR